MAEPVLDAHAIAEGSDQDGGAMVAVPHMAGIPQLVTSRMQARAASRGGTTTTASITARSGDLWGPTTARTAVLPSSPQQPHHRPKSRGSHQGEVAAAAATAAPPVRLVLVAPPTLPSDKAVVLTWAEAQCSVELLCIIPPRPPQDHLGKRGVQWRGGCVAGGPVRVVAHVPYCNTNNSAAPKVARPPRWQEGKDKGDFQE